MKYKLTNETLNYLDKILYRIEALKDFGNVKKGDLGGFIEKESNLSQDGNARVYDNARVSGNARVYDNARVSGDARVYGNAIATKKVININLTYNTTLTDNHIQIGCKQFTYQQALKLHARWKNTLENVEVAQQIEKDRQVIVALIKRQMEEE